MADLGSRTMLPDGTTAFSSANMSQPESREKHKNYVFVDEHNRHRRLKVMRACAACRRRKIKCDAATTNTWPCAPCVKQQLECVPPSSDEKGVDDVLDEQSQQPQNLQHGYHHSMSSTSPPVATTYQQQISIPASYGYPPSLPSATSTYFDGSVAGSSIHHPNLSSDSMTPITPQGFPQHAFQQQRYQGSPSTASIPQSTPKGDTPDSELADVLRELKIDQAGVAPYIANQQNLGEVPAVEEHEPAILPPQTFPNSTVRIPVEMMPSDQQANKYFEYFFTNIHPYVPVISRATFYRMWQMDPYSVPPLILEGIFACSAHMLGHNEDRSRWLALAARHEETFRDMPRLSTIQGLILVMKARESAPRRGYYYRSWVTIQSLINMGKDLGLHTHNKLHCQGQPCSSDISDCALKTRVWHTLFQLELMIGGPQGRFDFNVGLETVNLQVPQALPGIDFSELKISQDQTYFVRLIHNVRVTAALYKRIKETNGDCSTDRDFRNHNEDYARLSREFPAHLQIKYPEDGSPPSIPFHFVANLQAYHLLTIIMHYRPQLEMNGRYDDKSWKDIMAHCHDEATKICRLHEAILQRTGLNGLLCMVRGINTTIYTILSCTLLHLVAITSPDTTLNEKAKDYFTRHMRILEQCSNSWPVPQVQVQIQSLRQAFSADLNKPFELRPNFPFGSPKTSSDAATPPGDAPFISQVHPHQRYTSSYEGTPVTPPSNASMAASQDLMSPASFASVDPAYSQAQTAQWDPSGVFDRWHTAFNPTHLESPSPGISSTQMHQATVAPTSAPMYNAQPHQQQQQPSYFAGQQNMTTPTQAAMASPTYPTHMTAQQGYLDQGPAATPSAYGPSVAPYVTPSMWQDAVARSSGWKRGYDGDGSEMSYKRMR